jgi:6-phosphofructokinase 1
VVKRLGVLTGGGDAPGLNAAIRAVVRASTVADLKVIGIEDGFDGLANADRCRRLGLHEVTGILRIGGTILGTTNSGLAACEGDAFDAYAAARLSTFRELGLDGLIAIGGDGTIAIAHRFQQRGLPVIAVPKTIDNDIAGTAMTFGFDTAVAFATEAIDRLHTTAEAHHRTMVVELMGRYAGWLALHAGLGGGADVILIPEIPYRIERVAERVLARERHGARFSVVVAAEGAHPVGEPPIIAVAAAAGRAEKLGGIGASVSEQLEAITNKPSRYVVLGHLQRGGMPTSYDRTLATRFGAFAVQLARRGEFGVMVALKTPHITAVPLADVVGKTKTIPADADVLQAARDIGICLGE